ncbi:MAG: MotA/TolQ/ExbB proton channel family protein [Bacteroidia bacterium]
MLGLQIDSAAAVANAAGQVVSSAGAKKVTILQLYLDSWYILIPITLLFFATIYLLVERYLAIKRSMRVDRGQVLSLYDALRRGNVELATSLCKGSEYILLKILGAGVERLGAPAPEIDGAMSSYGNVLIGRITGRLNYLGIISGVAPMLGFIGTILGIIKIFYSISLTDNISIGVISGGLYEKMISSCAGLVVGMVAYGGMHLLNAMVDRFTVAVEAESYEFMNVLHQPVHEA